MFAQKIRELRLSRNLSEAALDEIFGLMRGTVANWEHEFAYPDDELIDEIAKEISTLDFGKMRLKIYVFSPGRYAFTDNFREVEDKVELIALPAAIYDAYQKVLPKRREKLFDEENNQDNVIPSDLFAEQEEGGEA